MTLKDARKFIKQCETEPTKYERTALLSQGPGNGWAVEVEIVGGQSYIVYSLTEATE